MSIVKTPLKVVPKVVPIVVFDTNIILSALLFNHSQLSKLRQLWQQEKVVPLASKATISELMRVLAYPKFKLSNLEQQDFLNEYLPYIKTIANSKKLVSPVACRDVNDMIFLELALAGKADYLITGDQDLLVLQAQCSFEIVTPATFMSIIASN